MRRNAPRVRKGLDAAPKHSKIFMGDRAEFYACLVGAYFRYQSKKAVRATPWTRTQSSSCKCSV